MRRSQAISAAAAAVLVLIGNTPPVAADHDDEVGWGWGMDDRSAEWWFDANGPATDGGSTWGANNLALRV